MGWKRLPKGEPVHFDRLKCLFAMTTRFLMRTGLCFDTDLIVFRENQKLKDWQNGQRRMISSEGTSLSGSGGLLSSKMLRVIRHRW